MFCSKCGKEIPEAAEFCPVCGNKTGVQKNIVAETVEKVKDNEFVKSVKQDLGNSQSINMIKDKIGDATEKAKNADPQRKKKIKIIAVVATIVIAVLLIVINIHECEDCGKIYLGKENYVSFWGEGWSVCNDCYDSFYSW